MGNKEKSRKPAIEYNGLRIREAAIVGNNLLPAVLSGDITKNDYLRASCRLLEQDWLQFYSESQLAYFRQVIDAWENVHPNGR
jgi:hypothetical protein